jgi:23S rRNA pseudouridine1911/1915/1917 synthase
VHNSPPAKEGTILTWLWEAPNQIVKVVNAPQEGAKEAITHYQLVEAHKTYSLLDIELETGRKNQIRVHLAHIGCPIAGDWRYGAPKVADRPIHLLAYSLRLPHPITGKTIAIELPLPRKFLKVLGKR